MATPVTPSDCTLLYLLSKEILKAAKELLPHVMKLTGGWYASEDLCEITKEGIFFPALYSDDGSIERSEDGGVHVTWEHLMDPDEVEERARIKHEENMAALQRAAEERERKEYERLKAKYEK